ncbi:MAG TPA: hypothetical protein VK694_04465 [Verrucomicrobiae bacterium]|nr:hypothetical protein [Verrucomicrobiae bacterium]
MDNVTSNVLVPLFFIHGAIGTALLAKWFLGQKQESLKYFGVGLASYAAGMAIWTLVVLTKPADIKPLILVGVIPFLLGHLAYAKAASLKSPSKSTTLVTVTAVLLVATFIARTFFYRSQPYFSGQGLLYFGLQSVPVALYIATISVSFLPAIRAVVADMKKTHLKSIMGVGLTTLYVNSIILVSAKDDTLLLINGVVLTLALLTLWVKALCSSGKA